MHLYFNNFVSNFHSQLSVFLMKLRHRWKFNAAFRRGAARARKSSESSIESKLIRKSHITDLYIVKRISLSAALLMCVTVKVSGDSEVLNYDDGLSSLMLSGLPLMVFSSVFPSDSPLMKTYTLTAVVPTMTSLTSL